MPQQLDGYTYALDPRAGGDTGVRPALRRVDIPTIGGNTSLYWDPVWPDTLVRQEWEQMDAAQYMTLQAKYLADGGGRRYAWLPGDGHTYEVEIIALEGRPYKGQTYIRVAMTLKIHAQVV